jgi:hypothetical protein
MLIDNIDKNHIPQKLLVTFITLLVNWYNNRFLPLMRQFFLIPKELMSSWISDCNASPPA